MLPDRANFRIRRASVFMAAISTVVILAAAYGSVVGEASGMNDGEPTVAPHARPSPPEIFPSKPTWASFASGSFTIYYSPAVDLQMIERHLRKRWLYGSWSQADRSATIEGKIGARLEALLMRTKEILDMNVSDMSLTMRIFGTREDLNAEYRRSHGTSSNVRSYYVHDLRTIFTSEDDISDSVVAHEIGHAIIDQYFAVPPPEKVAELIATYVDLHLDD